MIRLARLALIVSLAAASAFGGEIPRENRDLIAIVNLSRLATSKFKLNYKYEESRAAMKIRRDLGRRYRKVTVFENGDATHANFLAALAAAEAEPSVRAIDVIVYLHGHPGAIGFVDTGFYPTDRLRDEILALPSPDGASPTKLRALYSDACYGASHMADWLRAGFRVASGADGVDGNWSLDLHRFMAAWRRGKSFGTAIGKANRVWMTPLMDWIAGGNSHKETDGDVAFTIDRDLAP